jgi:hypothetical protein
MKLILAPFFFCCCSLILCFSEQISAQIPRTISYQGVLADPNGVIVKDGNHTLILTL